MAYPAPDRLTLLPLPQVWDPAAAGVVSLRILTLPRGNPLVPLMTGTPGVPDGPAFADAELQLRVLLIPSTARLPDPADVTAQVDLVPAPAGDRRSWFETMAGLFDIDPAIEADTDNPRRAGRQIKKLLVPSYLSAFPFAGPRTPYAVLDDSYACALRRSCTLTGPQGPPPTTLTSWGRVIAQALRQPLLTQRLGLLHTADLTLPAPDLYAAGGWLYLTLAPASAYYAHAVTRPELVASYATRLPALGGTARALFAPVLFPVTAIPPPGDYDELYAEAAAYDDGFAKIVHCAQRTTADPAGLEGTGLGPRQDGSGEPGRQVAAPPPVRDTGLQLGWDDEQLAIWMNRQIADPAVEQRSAPAAVLGYRVDVRAAGTPAWHSLVHVRGDLAVGGRDLDHFDGELHVEVGPLQLDNQEAGDFWMPAYFTQWLGQSLIADDTLGLRLSGGAPAGGDYEAVEDAAVPLRYGRRYDFRVRLVDISGGGPPVAAAAVNPSAAPVATCRFRRHVPPDRVTFGGLPQPPDPANPPGEVTVARPRLGYPAAMFTSAADAADVGALLLADAERIRNEGQGDVPAIPDPDTATAEITVQVAAPEYDVTNDLPVGADRRDGGNPPLRTLYTITRPFPADPAEVLRLELDWVDVADARTLAAPTAGALPVPRARDVLLTVRAVGPDDPALEYFGSAVARFGQPATASLRADAVDESGLYTPAPDTERLRCVLLAPEEAATASLLAQLRAAGRGTTAEDETLRRLADALDLQVAGADGVTLDGPPRVRTVFGCSAALAHTLAPGSSTVSFASKADLADRWLAVLTVQLDRDWTWDGVGEPAFEITRDGLSVGQVSLPRSVHPALTGGERSGGEVDRAHTRLVFFDAVDPYPVPPAHPAELQLRYEMKAVFRDAPAVRPDPLRVEIHLPIAAPPVQTPRLVSAGIALSPYERSADYASTQPRERMLWLEFDAPPENPDDGYFARVLSYAPDPMLTRSLPVTNPPEPPLPIDPEPIRVIRPGQSDDRAGLGAMHRLLPTVSPRHFLLPRPPGLSDDARELFGFFCYELRLGHVRGWSTARARFGPPLRVTGLQHPAPTLACQAFRVQEAVQASALHATPVFEGRNLTPPVPATVIWLLLYAQVVQADGADRRNILLGRRRGWIRQRKLERRDEPDVAALVRWTQDEIEQMLTALGLPADSPLSVLAVELLPEALPASDPVGVNLGDVRILRTSPLTPIPQVCPEPVC